MQLFEQWVMVPAIKEVEGNWWGGPYSFWMTDFLQAFNFTMGVMPRRHSKSTKNYVWLAWQMWKLPGLKTKLFPTTYISYLPTLAGAHVENFKRYVDVSEHFKTLGFKDDSRGAKHLATYKAGANEFKLTPFGMKGGIRGTNAKAGIFDDIYTDPDDPHNPKIVYKVNRLLKTSMISLVQGPYHIRGTALSLSDLWFDEGERAVYSDGHAIQILKAINIDNSGQEYAIWPENPFYTLEELQKLRKKIVYEEPGTGKLYMFDQEFQGQPLTALDSKYELDRIYRSIDPELSWYHYDREARKWLGKFENKGMVTIGSWDLGRFVHPAHFCVWVVQSGTWTQIASEWMNGVKYETKDSQELSQLDILKQAISFFGLRYIYADNTNQAIQGIVDRGDVPSLVPISIGPQVKLACATAIDRFLGTPYLKLLPDARQRTQLHNIKKDLSCSVTFGELGGHGEPLTTIGLAIEGPRIHISNLEKAAPEQQKVIAPKKRVPLNSVVRSQARF
jgi:hypothetical protein